MANMLENQAQLNINNTSMREQLLSMVRGLPEYVEPIEYTEYAGDNPLIIGEDGANISANTLLTNTLQIVNGIESGITAETLGFTKVAVDLFVYSGSSYCDLNNNSLTIPHSLGEVPKMIIFYAPTTLGTSYYIDAFIINSSWNFNFYPGTQQEIGVSVAHIGSVESGAETISANEITLNSNNIILNTKFGSYNRYIQNGHEFRLITMA